MDWIDTGGVAPRSLTAARLQLHCGALVLGSVANATLPESGERDDVIGYDPRHRSLCTPPLDAGGLALHLDLETLELALRAGDETAASFALARRTLADAIRWIGAQLQTDVPLPDVARLAAGPVLADGAFAAPEPASLTELARWFRNGDAVLAALRELQPDVTATRVRPRDFTLGAALRLDGGPGQAIDLGISPGDAGCDQPYVFCSPRPSPPAAGALPPLALGQWRTSGALAAMLTADELHGTPSQPVAVKQFVNSALIACSSLIA